MMMMMRSMKIMRRMSTLSRRATFGQNEELAFAWITPNALAKSLEGAILVRRSLSLSTFETNAHFYIFEYKQARLLSVPGLELVGARMLQPSDAFVDEYVDTMKKNASETEFKHTMMDFVDTELRYDGSTDRGYPNWMMMLLFKGENARSKLSVQVGAHSPHSAALGTTIRGAFGDYNRDNSGKIDYFQPSVVAPLTDKCNREYLEVFAKYAQKDGGVVDHWWFEHDGDTDGDGQIDDHETGLLMIKPDNLERPSSLPGHIIDMISTTGLHCRGCKVFSMTPAMGRDFYGFLEGIFEKKLVGLVEKKLRRQIGTQCSSPFSTL